MVKPTADPLLPASDRPDASRARIERLFAKRSILFRARNAIARRVNRFRRRLANIGVSRGRFARGGFKLTWNDLKAIFPERQLFIRSRGQFHFQTLSPRKQMALLAISIVPLLLIVAGLIGLGLQQSTIATREGRIAELMEEQSRLIDNKDVLIAELAFSKQHYREVTSQLELKHATLDKLLQARTSLEQRVLRLRASLAALETERELRRADQIALGRRHEHLRERLTRTSYLSAEPEGSLAAEPKLLQLSLGYGFGPDATASTLPERPRTEFALQSTNRLLAFTAAERDAVRLENRDLQTRSQQLENRLTDLQEMQNSLIARIESGTEAHIGELEKVIQLTGLDVDRLLERMEGLSEGVGGPFVGITAPNSVSELTPTPQSHPESTDTMENRFSHAVNRMGVKLARWSALSVLAERLPLAAPVEPYRLTSRFGKRRDPFTKRVGRHEGVDLAGARRSPILAAASGRVSYSGRKGPYGRLIEIDHGYGLKTRYGHLYRSYVKVGDEVTKGERIAVMGSSGRSTGRHLHYEVHYDDQPLDPTTFLKAGDHVFKDGQK